MRKILQKRVLDPGHVSASLSADHMIEFVRAIGLEVTLASYGLLEDFLLRARNFGNLGVRGQPGSSPPRGFVGSAVGDRMVSQSRYFLPAFSGFTPTIARNDVVQGI